MTETETYRVMLLHRKCLLNQVRCSKQCTQCDCYVSEETVVNAIDKVNEILKVRNPELYFASQVDTLISRRC